jgi:hypothetical protein
LVSGKRVFWATVLGIVAGILCYVMGRTSYDFTTLTIITTILNRTLIGFLIGISSLRWPWAAHGIFWGLLISLLIAIPALGEGPQRFFLFMIAGAVWGFLVELFTTKVFTAPTVKIG